MGRERGGGFILVRDGGMRRIVGGVGMMGL